MDLKIGDIILVKGQGLISETIESIEHSKYSHATIYVGKGKQIEAEGFEKTGYVSIDKYKGQADIYRCNQLTPKQKIKILVYLDKQVGTHYDYLLLLWEFLRYRLHLVFPFKDEFNSHICSTLAADAYESVGIDLCPGIKYPSPGDLSKSKLLIAVGSL